MGVKCGNVAWPGIVCSRKRHTLEIPRRGIYARSCGASGLSCVAWPSGHGSLHFDQCGSSVLWNLCRCSDLLEAPEIVSEESVLRGSGSLAGESPHHIAAARPRDARLPSPARMDIRRIASLVVALDVRARSAVSGQKAMRLILAVFGIAAILIVIWVILWVFASKAKD